MIDPDLYEDFVKRDRKKFNDNRINTSFNNSNLINLDVKASNSALGKLTKKMEAFEFKKDEKINKKSNFFTKFIF